MEFLTRHRRFVRPGGVEILVNRRVAHEDFVEMLARPHEIWKRPEIILDHESKNRLGHGRLAVGFIATDVFVKEFLPKSALDPLLNFRRAGRAARAFMAGLEMRRLDLPTPEPLAAVTLRRGGCVRRSWLITEWLGPWPSLRAIRDRPEQHRDLLAVWPWEHFLDALGRLLRRLHGERVVHRDLSLRNVLAAPPGESPSADPPLWLVDLNRVLLPGETRWTIRRAACNFERLRLGPEEFERVLRAAFPDQADFEALAPHFRRQRERHVLVKRLKRTLRGG